MAHELKQLRAENERLKNYIKPIPKASKEDVRLGWIRGVDLIHEIERRTYEAGYPAGMEETQEVITALIDMGYLEQENDE